MYLAAVVHEAWLAWLPCLLCIGKIKGRSDDVLFIVRRDLAPLAIPGQLLAVERGCSRLRVPVMPSHALPLQISSPKIRRK